MESTPQNSIGKKKLLPDQFSAVQKRELEAGEKFEKGILDFSTSAEDVILWWKTRDPLLETFEHKLSSEPKKFEHEIDKQYKLFLHGALIILLNVINNNYYSEKDVSKWEDLVSQCNKLKKTENSNGEIFLKLFNFTMEKLKPDEQEKQKGFGDNVQDIEQLLICAEMAGIGIELENTETNRYYYLKQAVMINISTLNFISSYISLIEQPNSTEDELTKADEIRMLGLKGSMLINAFTENYHKVYEDGSKQKLEKRFTDKALYILLSDFHSLFAETNESNTIWKRLKSPIVKGALHEALWYLDFIMLKHMYPEKYDDIHLTPASSYANRPEIGNPENNRAYDFFVDFVKMNGEESSWDFLQLKSSPQSEDKPGSKKKYHPSIKVIQEQNFLDVNPSRLRAKINTYKRIQERGFQNEDKEQLEKYILPTVKEYLDELVKKVS